MLHEIKRRNLEEIFFESPLYETEIGLFSDPGMDILAGYVGGDVLLCRENGGLENTLRRSIFGSKRTGTVLKNKRIYQVIAIDSYLSLINDPTVQRIIPRANSIKDLRCCLFLEALAKEGLAVTSNGKIEKTFQSVALVYLQQKQEERGKDRFQAWMQKRKEDKGHKLKREWGKEARNEKIFRRAKYAAGICFLIYLLSQGYYKPQKLFSSTKSAVESYCEVKERVFENK